MESQIQPSFSQCYTLHTYRRGASVIEGAFCRDSFERERHILAHDDAWLADMTNWAVPEFPRNQVDKAGAVFINRGSEPEELLWALAVINNWRSSHSYPLLHLRINLKRNLKRIEPNAIVAQRIKRLESISTKLASGTMELSQMQDIGGCRGIVSSTKSLERIIELYMKSSSPHILKWKKTIYLSRKKTAIEATTLYTNIRVLCKPLVTIN
jgi:hypothetical protein